MIPNADGLREQCLRAAHNSEIGGHFGVKKRVELARRLYWWPTLEADVTRHVRECATCQRIKAPTHAPYGQLQSPEIPTELWESSPWDLITKLPTTKQGHDCVLVVVDRFSKYAKFKACRVLVLTESCKAD